MGSIPDITAARIRWVDVFATVPLTGNPLAVVLCDTHPPRDAMQALAAELGLSETVFAARGDRPSIRIFTPATEIPMAGHPLVGCAWVLHDEGWTGRDATLLAPGGEVVATADATGADIAPPPPHHVRDVSAGEVARAIGGTATGMAPVWNAGLSQVMLAVDDPQSLVPDHDAVRALGARDGWAGVSAYRIEQASPGIVTAEVRHFAMPIGIAEDPVTGSAAGALGAALAAAGHAAHGLLHLTVRQGHGMGRAGEVRVTVHTAGNVPTALRVGGRVLPVMQGTIG
jgi:trans-2,3-dihydro-3-hydroxyanthranilate isomerase